MDDLYTTKSEDWANCLCS